MINPITEVRALARAALADPVPADHTEPDRAFRLRVVALQRRVSGGILAPTVTQLVWSLGMLFLLPPALARFS